MSLPSLMDSALEGGSCSRRKQCRKARKHYHTKKGYKHMLMDEFEDASPEIDEAHLPSCATVKRCIGTTIMLELCSTAQSRARQQPPRNAGAEHFHRPGPTARLPSAGGPNRRLDKKETSRSGRCRTRQATKHMLSCVQQLLTEELYEDLHTVGW